jgi:rRNA maturation protein Nop10
MRNNKCLNCTNETINNFCSVCGQKNSTHRFTIQHFLHDFLHGVFHLDKGFFYTLKELFTRPGHSTREYIQGKRVNIFNAFTLMLILIALLHFAENHSIVKDIDLYKKEYVIGYDKVAKDFEKIIPFVSIPFLAILSFLLFRRSKQNYVENIVLNLYLMCGILTIVFIPQLIRTFNSNLFVFGIIHRVQMLIMILYVLYFIYQYNSVFKYKRYSLVLRSIVFVICFALIQNFYEILINYIGNRYF